MTPHFFSTRFTIDRSNWSGCASAPTTMIKLLLAISMQFNLTFLTPQSSTFRNAQRRRESGRDNATTRALSCGKKVPIHRCPRRCFRSKRRVDLCFPRDLATDRQLMTMIIMTAGHDMEPRRLAPRCPTQTLMAGSQHPVLDGCSLSVVAGWRRIMLPPPFSVHDAIVSVWITVDYWFG